MWLTYLAAAMQALTTLEAADAALAPVITQVNNTIAAAQADGNRDPTPEERKALDDVINAELAKLDAE
jgi:uracil-DNA glycosylase